jgi:hypothetical protein
MPAPEPRPLEPRRQDGAADVASLVALGKAVAPPTPKPAPAPQKG